MDRLAPATALTILSRIIRYLIGVLLFVSLAQADPVTVQEIRVGGDQTSTRIVLELSGSPQYKIFTLNNPHRVVVDLESRGLSSKALPASYDDTPVTNIRHAMRSSNALRIVLDVSSASVPKTFLIPANQKDPTRLVIDLAFEPGAAIVTKTTQPPVPKSQDRPAVPQKPVIAAKRNSTNLRNVIIAIDPGHGGKDPGAIGGRGTREKDVVLQIARQLAATINYEPGMSAVLTRNDDRFIPLRGRIIKARELKADVFLSIHADSFRDRNAHGSSVFVLSPHGASSEAARILAEQENQADLIGGVDLEGKDDTLKRVLVDLSQTATIDDSNELARHVLRELGRVNRTRKVERAGFAVLKSPDIPSILIETAFISNPAEENRLRNAQHQQQLAQAVVRGLKAYFNEHAPDGTYLASNNRDGKHVIKSGETLSGIAQRYQVSIQALKSLNSLSNDRIRVGQTLVIPGQLGS